MSFRDYLDPGGSLLARRLEQLCSTLEDLSARLRGTLVHALGETLSGIVRDTTLHVLREVGRYLPVAQPIPLRSYREPVADLSEERNYWADVEPRDHSRAEAAHDSAPATPQCLPTALATGLHAAAWWLTRWAGQGRVLTSLAVGVAASSLAYLGGPLVAAVLQVAGTMTQFSTLAEGIAVYDSVLNMYDRT